jgi:rhamnose transport system ATP-binding protein
MADRIMVMHEGILEAEFSRREADADKVIRAATGHAAEGGAA